MLTFVVKAIYTVYTSAFVVATQNEKVLWVFDLVGQKKTDGLKGLFATVYIVAQEQIVRFRWKAAVFK